MTSRRSTRATTPPPGAWSNGTTLWITENGSGGGDAIYAYDLATGERVAEREFALDDRNRAPRGVWSDRVTLWVSDSGHNRLYAHDLESGERLPERDIELDRRNGAARGIWADADGQRLWVLDDHANAIFVYDLASGDLLAEYALDDDNDSPHGLWSDGVTIWVSNHDPRRLFAYRLPAPEERDEATEEDAPSLERVHDEEFTELSTANNNSPRGLWSDGEVMYVVDEGDDKVYSYNMPDAIDARLASLTLSGVDIGEFSSARTEYDGVAEAVVTETTVEAEALQRRTEVTIDPPDADGDEENGHQVVLEGVEEITVTVMSADGSRERGLPGAAGRPGAGGRARALGPLPARRCRRRLQPRRLRGWQRRGADHLRGEPGHRGLLRPACGRLRLLHPRSAGLPEPLLCPTLPRRRASAHAAGRRERWSTFSGPERWRRRPVAGASVPARRHRRGASASSSTRAAVSTSLRPARGPWTSPRSTSCTTAPGSPTSS